MITFRIAEHDLRQGIKIVEVLMNSQMVATIYPKDPDGIKIVSAHFVWEGDQANFAKNVVLDDGKKTYPPIPAIEAQFAPQPYYINNTEHCIVRIKGEKSS